jgi:N-acetylglucosamine kinase-like BadF-type ATPase
VAIYLGVDGGQTETRAVAVDGAGVVVASCRAPGLVHPLEPGGAEHLQHVLSLVRQAVPGDYRVRAAYLALTGVESPESPSHQTATEVAQGLWPDAELTIDNDGVAAWAGGTAGRPGVAAMAGTGSVVVAVNESGRRVRTGGWGPVLGDAGGGWRIGLMALRQMLRRWDAGLLTSDLDQIVLAKLGASSPAAIPVGLTSGRIPRVRVADLAPVIAARAGVDPAAQNILAEAASEFAVDVEAAMSRLSWSELPITVVPLGNVFRAGQAYLEPFERALAARAKVPFRIQQPILSNVGGAVVLSLRLAGLLTQEMTNRLAATELAYEGGGNC